MSSELKEKWHDLGVKAGKTEGWMNLEETLAEDIERHRNLARSPEELVQLGIEGWEETDHFQILYGSKMAQDASGEFGVDILAESDDALEAWQDYKTEFWEGYIAGRQSIGIDVYKRARELLGKGKPQSKQKKAKGKKKKSSPRSGIRGIR